MKSSESFAAPASDGLTRPDGDTGSYFMWLGSDGKLYAPGDSVPADVTKLTAQFALSEQFSLKPGDTYYFDLSGASIPGTVNTGNIFGATSLPDTTLHYGPHLAVHIAAAPCPVLIDSVDGDTLLHTARHLAAAVGSLGGRILT